jgi:hypothetical protein
LLPTSALAAGVAPDTAATLEGTTVVVNARAGASDVAAVDRGTPVLGAACAAVAAPVAGAVASTVCVADVGFFAAAACIFMLPAPLVAADALPASCACCFKEPEEATLGRLPVLATVFRFTWLPDRLMPPVLLPLRLPVEVVRDMVPDFAAPFLAASTSASNGFTVV